MIDLQKLKTTFNPFRHIAEKRENEYLNTIWLDGFIQRCKDTFLVFSGTLTEVERNKKRDHIGLWDLLVFPYLIDKANIFCNKVVEKGAHPLKQALCIPVFFLAIVSYVARLLVSSIFTVAALPFILAVDVYSRVKNYFLKRKILNTQIKPNVEQTTSESTCSIKKVLAQHQLELNNVLIENSIIKNNKITIKLKTKYNVLAEKEFDLSDKESRQAVKAMLKLNLGKITTNLIQNGTNFSLFKKRVINAKNENTTNEIKRALV